ncbi:hypothetical protein DFP72DRAFT_883646 [Ephemerocybe angulata]|uniref:Uncharacterized protein n=1 Tax=Ephemerocybe angulata TaxID=980116 RepID=A0A8H6MBX4_9AGAR|nr:hypothetical protein DFP72DRAFT_883646 [Tulosesus angulatus]
MQNGGYRATSRNPPRAAPVPTRTSGFQPKPAPQPPPPRPNPPPRQPSRIAPAAPPVQQPYIPQNYRPHAVNRAASTSNGHSRHPSPAPVPGQQDQMRLLQQQLEEAQKAMSKMQADLRAAQDAKTAKEGEVTILRKTMEKNAKEHADETARLKTAKQEADVKQVQMQKHLKEEMDRLKTQLMFKQQELEASLRKPPGSARAKRIARDQRAIFNNDSLQTPSRPLFVPPPKVISPRKSQSPLKPKKAATLPGFQNSFATSTPLRPSQKVKGKQREIIPDDSNVFNAPLPSQPFSSPKSFETSQAEKHLGHLRQCDFPCRLHLLTTVFSSEPQSSQAQQADYDGDVVMGQEPQEPEPEEVVGEVYNVDPPNWKAELGRIILTHIRPGCSELSFQLLLSVSFTRGDALEDSRRYTTCECLGVVSNSFIAMLEVLGKYKLRSPLASLFNLLATLVFFVPRFRRHIFGKDDPESLTSCPLVRVLCQVITATLEPLLGVEDGLGQELLGFIDAMALGLSDDDAPRFSELARNREVTVSLLSPTLPDLFLEGAVRTFVLLSARKSLWSALLSVSDGDQVEERSHEHMCSLLVDFNRLRDSILLYFGNLTIAHPDAQAHLADEGIVLGSILWHTSNLTKILYEEDEEDLIDSPSQSSQLVRYIYRALGSAKEKIEHKNIKNRLAFRRSAELLLSQLKDICPDILEHFIGQFGPALDDCAFAYTFPRELDEAEQEMEVILSGEEPPGY